MNFSWRCLLTSSMSLFLLLRLFFFPLRRRRRLLLSAFPSSPLASSALSSSSFLAFSRSGEDLLLLCFLSLLSFLSFLSFVAVIDSAPAAIDADAVSASALTSVLLLAPEILIVKFGSCGPCPIPYLGDARSALMLTPPPSLLPSALL